MHSLHAPRTGTTAKRWAGVVAAGLLLTGLAACASDSAGSEGGGPATTQAPVANAEDVLGTKDAASGDPVVIGLVSDGAFAAADNTEELEAANATVAYLNDYKGGIGGRPIELVTCLTGGDPAKGTDCGNEMTQNGATAVVIGTSAVLDSVWEPLHAAKIPVILGQSGAAEIVTDDVSSFVLSDFDAAIVDAPLKLATDAGLDQVTIALIDVPAAVETYEGDVPDQFSDEGVDLELVKIPAGTADMTGLLQGPISSDPGVINVLGNDTFCISAFQAMHDLGYDGPVSAIGACITDATRTAIPGDQLEGITTPAATPVGADDESTELYRAVMETYADGVDPTRSINTVIFTTLAGMAGALDGITGDITSANVIKTMKAMDDQELPGGGGLHFRCNGAASEGNPAICTRGTLITKLDDKGHPTTYVPTSTEPIGD